MVTFPVLLSAYCGLNRSLRDDGYKNEETKTAESGYVFSQAAFSSSGNYLYAWAYGQSKDYLYVWEMQENKATPYHDGPYTAVSIHILLLEFWNTNRLLETLR